MIFNSHLHLEGQHAFLSASKYHWVNYDEEKLVNSFRTAQAAMKGTETHEFAFQCIKRRQKLPRSKKTLNMYVNDALGFRMQPEQLLYYSDNCFGTADAISFKPNPETGRHLLRIHDLKTGVSPSSMKQLEIYTALFCLEYGFRPGELDVELRIYQKDDVEIHVPNVEDIVHIIGKIIKYDQLIENLRTEVEL